MANVPDDGIPFPPERVEHFFLGGHYEPIEAPAGYQIKNDDETLAMVGQVYVEHHVPLERSGLFPIVVLSHSGGMVWFKQTPDGRPGWVNYFLSRGIDVYLLHQVGGPTSTRTTREVEAVYTAISEYGVWGRARLHTQWPGTGKHGDPVFDQFFASSVGGRPRGGFTGTRTEAYEYSRDGAVALLDRIGPAIVLSHSQSGELGWMVGDARPDLVKAIVAHDPMGPPFKEPPMRVMHDTEGKVIRPYGLTAAPIAYDPPVVDPATELAFYEEEQPDEEDLFTCRLQAGEPRQLANLRKVKVLVVTGEASYHAHYDHCTVKYLRQAGVDVTHMRLEEVGLRGNGHVVTAEKNNLDIAAAIVGWLHERELAP